MRLSIFEGYVVLSQENKNIPFVNDCYGLFSDCIDGKQKMYWLDPEQANSVDSATEYNAWTLNQIILNGRLHGSGEMARIFGVVEIDEAVLQLNAELQAKAQVIKERRRALLAQIDSDYENRQKWARLCKNGCGKCGNLAYDIDMPICKQTGHHLEEKNVPQTKGGMHYCFRLEPFPSEGCPFNINKNKEKTMV